MTTATQDDDNVMENKESETGVGTTRNIPDSKEMKEWIPW